jgi:4-alpha-glucanotransferase
MAGDQGFQRSSGILLHVTSLPGPWGIGDLGPSAYHFIDWLVSTGQSYWQMLPVGPTGYGDSPYALLSLFGGNPLLISLDLLIDAGLLPDAERPSPASGADARRVDYGRVIGTKLAALKRATEAFRRDASPDEQVHFEEFVNAQSSWIGDYCRFMALKEQNSGRPWQEWQYHEPDPDRLHFQYVTQYWFHRQWSELRAYAHAQSIQFIGDVPIYPAYDSADVWAHPQYYQLDASRRPIAVAGVPPDYFSPTGQLWGNPVYDWDALRRDGFSWWIERLRYLGELFDVLRLDHFRGFAAYWRVRAGEPTAQNGQWVTAPGYELFEALIHAGVIRAPGGTSGIRIVAEDLGLITPDVYELRDRFGFPGMRVLQFGFDGSPRNPHLPHNYDQNLVAYTATHDNDTMCGWYASLDAPAKDLVQWYLGRNPTQWNFIRDVAASVANLSIFPLQDVLGLGSEARMNFPGRGSDNWAWRFTWEQVTEDVGNQLRLVTDRYARLQE